jgi:hypothetical protein
MPININEKEIQQVVSLPGEKRYKYFLNKVADTGLVWGLYNNGWALAEDNLGRKVLPLWPASEYAKMCANAFWEGYKPEPVDVYDFLNSYINELRQEGILIAVFYTNNDKGIIPSYEKLEKDILLILSEIE